MPQPDEWSSWIIGTLVTVITTAVGTIVGLTKILQSLYLSKINEVEKDFTSYKAETKVELDQLKKESVDCQRDRYNLAIKVAALESELSHTPQHPRKNSDG